MWPENAHFWSQSAKSFNEVPKLFDRVVSQKNFFFYKGPLNSRDKRYPEKLTVNRKMI